MVLKGVSETGSFLEFDFLKGKTIYGRHRYLTDPTYLDGVSTIRMRTFINRDRVHVLVAEPVFSRESILLRVNEGETTRTFEPQESKENVFFCFSPLHRQGEVDLEFLLVGAKAVKKSIRKKLQLATLRTGVSSVFSLGAFEAEFAKNSVREAKTLHFETVDFPGSYPLLSKQISLSPFHFPFLDTVYYKFTKQLPEPRQVGIFRYSPRSKRWRYVYTIYEPLHYRYKTRVISSGIFALMRDIYLPRIGLRKPATKRLAKLSRLVLTITDKGKGVNDDTLSIQINGKSITAEYDPDWRHVILEKPGGLRPGKNIIRVRVQDHAGNQANRSFVLKLM